MRSLSAPKSILLALTLGILAGACATTTESPSARTEATPPAPVPGARMNSPPAKPSELLGRPELTAPQEEQPATTPPSVPSAPAKKDTATPYGAMLTRQPRSSALNLRPGVGYLDVTAERYSLELMDDQRRTVRMTDSTEQNGLPSGTYRMRTCTLSRTNPSGIEWRLTCYLPEPIRITAGETTTLAVGPPLTASLTASKQGTGVVLLQLALTGGSGERYVPASGTSKTMQPPKFQVRDGRGNIVASGAFRYG